MKKNMKTNGQTATQIFAAAMPETAKVSKTRHTLSTFEETVDRESEKAQRADLFDEMLAEQRGINANCKLFAAHAADSRMLAVIRLAGIKVRRDDFAKIFSKDFISDNLRADYGSWRYNSTGVICKVCLPKSAPVIEKYLAAEYEQLRDESGKTRYLVPTNRLSFQQFVSLVKQAVHNYWKTVREQKQVQ